eukprot:267040_1
MSNINMYSSLQIADGFNNILDNVLDDIDGLLMSQLPLLPIQPQYNTYNIQPNIQNNIPIQQRKYNNIRNTKIISFEPLNDIKLQLKDYVFVSKDCTQQLQEYIVYEEWG